MAAVPALLDHLVFATPRLEKTLQWFEAATGVRPLAGGTHPAWRTRNAIVPLSPTTYLEIIGPDPAHFTEPPRIFRLDRLVAPQLTTWAAKGTNLRALVARADSNGIDLGSPSSGSRQRPDGSLLTWELTDPFQPREEGLLPFFIDWGTSVHPATAVTPTLRLSDFHAEHPDPEVLEADLTALGLDLRVERGPEPRLIATLATMRGGVTLS